MSYIKTLGKSPEFKTVWKTNRQRVRCLPTAYSAHDRKNEYVPNTCFLVILIFYILSDWFQGLPLPYVRQTYSIYLSSNVVLNGKQCSVLDYSTQTTWSIGIQAFHSTKKLEANISKDQNCRAQPVLCQRDISREIEHSWNNGIEEESIYLQ